MKPKTNLDHISKRTKLTTVSHLLTKEEVRDTIARATADQEEITDMIIMYFTRDGYPNYRATPSPLGTITLLIDKVKQDLLNAGEEEEPDGRVS